MNIKKINGEYNNCKEGSMLLNAEYLWVKKRLISIRPKVCIGSFKVHCTARGKTVICLEVLYTCPTVCMWYDGMYNGRVKIV